MPRSTGRRRRDRCRRSDDPRRSAAAGIAIGAVAGILLSAWRGTRSGSHFGSSVVTFAVIGATTGAAAGLLIGGAVAIVVRLLAPHPAWVVATGSGVVVGSLALAVLTWLGVAAYAAGSAVVTVALLGGITAANVGWRSRPG